MGGHTSEIKVRMPPPDLHSTKDKICLIHSPDLQEECHLPIYTQQRTKSEWAKRGEVIKGSEVFPRMQNN